MSLVVQLAKCFACLAIFIDCVWATEERDLLHHAVLDGDGRFVVRWGPCEDGSGLNFKLEVMARGYVSLGLSPNGGMAGSDVVTAWVRDGQVYLQDRYAEGQFMPRMDHRSQDWKLLSASENDTHTIVLFRRKLETCDPDDRTIDSSTVRMIYAYSDEDPSDEHSLSYHHAKRGVKSVMLLDPGKNSQVDLEGTSHWDVRSPNYTLTTAISSIYWCKILKRPEISDKTHIIMLEPLIEESHKSFVHHMILYLCIGSDADMYEEQLEAPGHQCYHPDMPEAMKTCWSFYAGLGIGAESFVLPEHVGMPLDSNLPKYFMLEVHYDNALRHDGLRDQSGFRMHYTRKLRRHDAAFLSFGAMSSPLIVIPPGQPEFVVAAHSSPECLRSVIPPEGIKMIAIFLHSHLLGRRMKVRHFRNEMELKPIAVDLNYDFNYQDYQRLPEELEFLPNDQITVECTYDSRNRKQTTFGGLSTQEEMCVVFVLYYPQIARFASLSLPSKQTVAQVVGGDELANAIPEERGFKEFVELLTRFDWNKTDIKSVARGLMFAEQDAYCYTGFGDKLKPLASNVSYPKDLLVYEEPSSC